MINPTPGRIVWYRGADGKTRAAIVACVNGPFNLNLEVFGLSPTDPEQGHMECITHADPEKEPDCLPSWDWMPFQKEQVKAADARQLVAAADRTADEQRWRAHALDMALRTPGLHHHSEVLAAAAAYQAHIEGTPAAHVETKTYADGTTFTGTAPLPDHSPTSTLPPHQQRVIDEKRDLDDKLAKLGAFFDTKIFAGLDEAERQRLERQEEAMTKYSVILGERIAAFVLVDSTAHRRPNPAHGAPNPAGHNPVG